MVTAIPLSLLSIVSIDVRVAGAVSYSPSYPLGPSTHFNPGDTLISADGTHRLQFASGVGLEVVLVSTGTPGFIAPGTASGYGYAELVNGDLLVISTSGTTLWQSGTPATYATEVKVRNGGALVVNNPRQVIWDSSASPNIDYTNALANMAPMQNNELFGGGSALESCSTCSPSALSSKTGGESTQGSQPVGTVNGDFTTSNSLFDVPAVDGSLSMNLTYDSALATEQLELGANPTGFGYGWSSTLSDSLAFDGFGDPYVNDANTAQAAFTIDPGGATCPSADDSSYLKYTMPGSTYDYSAARRVDAQFGDLNRTGFPEAR